MWQVRAGRGGAHSSIAYDNNIITIGWNNLSDLSKYKDKKELEQAFLLSYPNQKPRSNQVNINQIWTFINIIKIGDLVVLPLPAEASVAIGEVKGNYEYREISSEVKHTRKVKWLARLPRSSFDNDILFSFGAIQTVCKIERNEAETRIRKMINSGFKDAVTEIPLPAEEGAGLDIEHIAEDGLIKYITTKFSGHALARLVEAILKAQGFVTEKSPPGKDGGVDILAGSSMLGLGDPRLCVQVKSSPSPVGTEILRQLQGTMQNFNAEKGLLVSWGGFTKDAEREAKQLFFSIRLWNQKQLVEELTKYYDKFDDELKAELPLKRIWALVEEEE